MNEKKSSLEDNWITRWTILPSKESPLISPLFLILSPTGPRVCLLSVDVSLPLYVRVLSVCRCQSSPVSPSLSVIPGMPFGVCPLLYVCRCQSSLSIPFNPSGFFLPRHLSAPAPVCVSAFYPLVSVFLRLSVGVCPPQSDR